MNSRSSHAKEQPEVIIECANSHGGDINLLKTIVDRLSEGDYENKSIKFQVFSPNTIALPDFSFYEIYKDLYFDSETWSELLEFTQKRIPKIWIDVFDVYAVSIVAQNIGRISGIKLQASILENHEVHIGLKTLDLTSMQLIINCSGYEVDEILGFLDEFESFGFREIVIQIGFQSYPTKIEDTALQKAHVIKQKIDNRICLADHADASDSFSLVIPVLGIAMGFDMVEKHVCMDRDSAKYDGFSSLMPCEFDEFLVNLKNYLAASSGEFISESERSYLDNSIQRPVLSKNVEQGSFVGEPELKYRRTSQLGLSYKEIIALQANNMLLAKSVLKNQCLTEIDFKKAKIGVIIACRMKSSRLKNKALLKIDELAAVEYCIRSCSNIGLADVVVLATSDLEEDQLLSSYLLNGSAKFFAGDSEDVISRYISATEMFDIDVVVRVTADCPLLSKEIAEILIRSHFETSSEYTVAKDFSIGTSCEIINTSALKRVIEYFGAAEYSEYMTWYFQNNPKHFKLNFVELDSKLVRNYRLTLDYQEDLDMMNQLVCKLNTKKLGITLKNIFRVLDEYPEISKMNEHIDVVYKTDKNLIELLDQKTLIVSDK